MCEYVPVSLVPEVAKVLDPPRAGVPSSRYLPHMDIRDQTQVL